MSKKYLSRRQIVDWILCYIVKFRRDANELNGFEWLFDLPKSAT